MKGEIPILNHEFAVAKQFALRGPYYAIPQEEEIIPTEYYDVRGLIVLKDDNDTEDSIALIEILAQNAGMNEFDTKTSKVGVVYRVKGLGQEITNFSKMLEKFFKGSRENVTPN